MKVRPIALGLLALLILAMYAWTGKERERRDQERLLENGRAQQVADTVAANYKRDEEVRRTRENLEQRRKVISEDFRPRDLEVCTANWAYSEAQLTLRSEGRVHRATLPALRSNTDTACVTFPAIVSDRGLALAVTAATGRPLANFTIEAPVEGAQYHLTSLRLEVSSRYGHVPQLQGNGAYGRGISRWTDRQGDGPAEWREFVHRFASGEELLADIDH